MSGLSVSDVTVPTLLEKLHRREWLVPLFQRDFVWPISAVIELIISIVSSHPIGMATLWEQPDKPELDLSSIFIYDFVPAQKQPQPVYFSELDQNPSKVFAILDGRQRCTAIAMAFGGLRAKDGRVKYAGRFYLDVSTTDDTKRIAFFKEADVKKKRLDADSSCVAQGFFPLATNQKDEPILSQWMRYLQSIKDPANYVDGKLPEQSELDRRDHVLKDAFEGIVNTKLAVYVVPDSYHLSKICDIFETLNTTGTKVSTVDLIHSWLYSETFKNFGGPINLRDWINDLGQKDGAIGWASSSDRPELVAQIVTACYLALQKKPAPRPVSGTSGQVASIKADDLLATPTLHWLNVIQNDEFLAELLGDFQQLVAGGYFPFTACPYPVSSAIYVALRWHHKFDSPDDRKWGREDLDVLFRPFFWQNALAHRYDQGFLSQISADIKQLKQWLASRTKFNSVGEWAKSVQKEMTDYMSRPTPIPARDQLIDMLTDSSPAGALQKAMTLQMIAGVRVDLIDNEINLTYPAVENLELHHIYPKGWCNKNRVGELADTFDKDKAGRNWIDSVANLMPLSRRSNNEWKDKIPGQLLQEKKIACEPYREILRSLFIDDECFRILELGSTNRIREFWERRAALIADDLINKTLIQL